MKIIIFSLALLIFTGCQTLDNQKTILPSFDSKIPRFSRDINLKTLKHYFNAYNFRGAGWGRFDTVASDTPRKINSRIQNQKYVQKQLEETSLLSYMVYENGMLIIDEITPKQRLGDFFNNDTKIYSMSLGKSLAGYLIGHAICQGYIESIEQPLDDWPLVKDTFISKLKLRDVINATMGNQSLMRNNETFKSGTFVDGSLKRMIVKGNLKGTKPGLKRFEYGQLSAFIALNYISFKTGNKFKDFSNNVLKNYVKLSDVLRWAHMGGAAEVSDGIIHPNFNATRSDTLRIGIAILEDWNSNSCVGKYLKDVYSNGVKKNPLKLRNLGWGYSRKYAGFFHTDYKTVNANVMGMDGYGGISMLINFDDSRIVYAHAINRDYDHKKLIFEMIRLGKIH